MAVVVTPGQSSGHETGLSRRPHLPSPQHLFRRRALQGTGVLPVSSTCSASWAMEPMQAASRRRQRQRRRDVINDRKRPTKHFVGRGSCQTSRIKSPIQAVAVALGAPLPTQVGLLLRARWLRNSRRRRQEKRRTFADGSRVYALISPSRNMAKKVDTSFMKFVTDDAEWKREVEDCNDKQICSACTSAI